MEITFKGRQTDVPARFREHATAKLERLEKLDSRAVRVDVEVSVERNPRQASQRERVELTVRSRGPAIRAEAAAEDRFAALDIALGKLDSRVRRALDRRKSHHGGHGPERPAERSHGDAHLLPEGVPLPEQVQPETGQAPPGTSSPGELTQAPSARSESTSAENARSDGRAADGASSDSAPSDSVVPIEMEGDGPLVVRQKLHHAVPISIDQALLEMELVGHDFYLFHDIDEDMPSVVYRRRGYQYGVIRLVENSAAEGRAAPVAASVPGRRRPESPRVGEPDLTGRSGNPVRPQMTGRSR